MVTTWTKNMDLNVGAQLKTYFQDKSSTRFPFITLSRQFGCDGINLANMLVDRLNQGNKGKEWFVLDREQLLEASDDASFTETTLKRLEEFGHSDLKSYIREAIFGHENQVETVRKMAKVQRLFANRGRVVFLGGAAPIITKDLSNGFHIHLIAPLDWRITNYASRWSIDESEARLKVVSEHHEREAYVKTYLGEDINNPYHYHMVINNSQINTNEAAEMVVSLLKAKKFL